jgi:hypothetical protein
MIKIHDYSYELIGNGVAYGYLPKPMEKGLLIIEKLYDGKWNFKFDSDVKNFIGPNGDISFQVWDGKDYKWFHGLVQANGKITQIG